MKDFESVIIQKHLYQQHINKIELESKKFISNQNFIISATALPTFIKSFAPSNYVEMNGYCSGANTNNKGLAFRKIHHTHSIYFRKFFENSNELMYLSHSSTTSFNNEY